MKRFKFNSECDKMIAQFISQNESLKDAFNECAIALWTTPKSVEGRYYRHKDEINAYIEDLKNKPVNPIVKFFKKLFGIID